YIGSSLTTLAPVASNDDETKSIRTSRVAFTAMAGQVYQISIDGYRGASGPISFTIDADSSDNNDNFANAALLDGTSISTSGNNFDATFETSEPRNVGSTGGRSVWWSWTAPSTGAVTIATAGS